MALFLAEAKAERLNKKLKEKLLIFLRKFLDRIRGERKRQINSAFFNLYGAKWAFFLNLRLSG